MKSDELKWLDIVIHSDTKVNLAATTASAFLIIFDLVFFYGTSKRLTWSVITAAHETLQMRRQHF